MTYAFRIASHVQSYVKIDLMSIRIVFMGSPDFALPSLKKLSSKYDVAGVFTQPDKPSGRGKIITPPPAKKMALDLGLKVFQPTSLKAQTVIVLIRDLKPDLIVVVAYGKLLPPEVLDIPPLGCINVHASLLPRWRGAAPIQAAILLGDSETGVTIMKMGVGLDDGPILAQKPSRITPDDTACSLSNRLALEGAELLLETLPEYINGNIKPIQQDETRVTVSPKLRKEDGLLDFNQTAEELSRRVRAFSPWPGAYFIHQGQPVRIFRVQSANTSILKKGEVGKISEYPAIGTTAGALLLLELQIPGKKRVSGIDFLHGARNWG